MQRGSLVSKYVAVDTSERTLAETIDYLTQLQDSGREFTFIEWRFTNDFDNHELLTLELMVKPHAD